jgi:hypothetical protein
LHSRLPPHVELTPGWHAPVPLQTFGVSVFPEHVAPHCVPLA